MTKKGAKICKMARDVIAKQQNSGLTQRAVADQIGVCPAALRNMLRGGKARNATKKKIASWLGETGSIVVNRPSEIVDAIEQATNHLATEIIAQMMSNLGVSAENFNSAVAAGVAARETFISKFKK